MKQYYLFIFTIGPVQSYIAQARKVQDLAAGSKILSNLMGFALTQFSNNDTIIFPQKGTGKASLSHRVLAVVNKDDIKTFADNLKNFVDSEFKKLSNEYDQQEHKDQLDSVIQCFWAAIKVDSENISTNEYQRIEHLLNSAKNTRTFNQLNEVAGRKCNLCGERNALFIKTSSFATVQSANIETNYKLNENEGLCTVCMTKRCFRPGIAEKFPSTASVAMQQAIEEAKPTMDNEIENYKSLFGKERWDDELFYEENLVPKNFEKNFDLKKALQTQKSIAKNLRFERFYALLNLDVDNLGLRMSNIESNVERIKLSEYLTAFSEKASKYIEENQSCPIYAGGDDFLALINLKDLFETLKELGKIFKEEVNQKMWVDKKYEYLTYSVGLVIAHYKTPLNEVLRHARELVKEAKLIDDDKNGVGLMYMVRASILGQTIIKNKQLDLLEDFTRSIDQKQTSGRFLNTFAQEMLPIIGDFKDKEQLEVISKAMRSELIRIAERTGKNKQKSSELAQKLFDEVLFDAINIEKGQIQIENLMGFGKLAEKLASHKFLISKK